MAIDDKRIEALFENFRHAISVSHDIDLQHKQALVERFRIELMLKHCTRQRKALYRAVIDMLEHDIEEETERLDAGKPKATDALVAYMKRLLDGMD